MNTIVELPQDDGFRQLLIFGAGGHGRELAWLAEQIWGDRIEIVHLVDRPEFLSGDINGRRVALFQEWQVQQDDRYVVAIGDSTQRERAVTKCDAAGLLPVTLVHPRTESSRWITIGTGSVVCAGSVLTTNIEIGRHAHINIGCTISHDVVIGDFATLSPGVHIAGNVHVEKHVFVGTGATIINGTQEAPLVIGEGAIIAAGSCVTGHVDPGSLVAGVPAAKKR